MTRPIHTPGPVEVEVKADKASDGRPFEDCYISSVAEGFFNGRIIADTFSADSVFSEADRKVNSYLLAAAYNAFDSAARKLGVNAVELAERMQDAQIAKLIETAENLAFALNGCRLIMTDKDSRDLAGEIVENAKALVAKAKGGAS